ncbi:MAG: DUF349 domain-containing protein [Bacteroidales bacterium]|jgi:hypothetical protein|nr:DUF349 domain-containing protein [Bacteroidales bacterium]
MENKEELNQNLEDAEMQNQEENAEAVQETVENDTKTESPNAILSEDIPEDQGETKKEEVNTTSSDDESYDFGREGKLDSEDCEDEDCDDDEENDEEVAEVGKDVVELSDEAYEKQYKDFKLADIITVLEVLSEEEDLRKSRSKVNILRRLIDKKLVELEKIELGQFIAKGGIEAEFSVEEATEYIRYKKVLGLFRAKRGKLRAQQEKEQTENLDKKKELLEELRNLVNSDETLKSTYDQFKAIQERWKEIGMIPKNEMGELWRNYHFLVEKFFDKVKISNELRDLDLKKNIEGKLQLCEKAEGLLLEKSITKSFKLLQKYHEEWKIIGHVPSNMKEEIWERFKAISDKINLRRREYYKQLQDKLDENYQLKLALCEKADAINYQNLSSIKEWNKSTDAFNTLFKEWKTIGPTPRKVNDEVWDCFKGHLNGFFNAKKKFFGEIKEEQANNYQKKLAICIEAEALQDDKNWKKTTDALIKLQKEWKNIGTVPRKYSDSVWKRFRKACDKFFEAKSEHYKGLVDAEGANAKLKTDLIEEISTAKFSDDKAGNLELIKSFQRRWLEIGNVPRKEMDKLNKAYREVIDMQLDKFDISRIDFKHSGFKEKIHNMKENVDNYQLNRERFGIQKTMEKLQEDVLLWENNIGFFANTKNADVLKMEFEKKINRAKADILSLKEKIRIIDQG